MKGIPTRYILTLLCFLGHFNSYTMRFNLSVAIVAMVKEPHVKSWAIVEEACTELLDSSLHNSSVITNESIPLEGEFDWNSNLRGQILASFFYGYTFTQIPGGRLAEKYGGKWVYGIGMLLTSVFTLLTPLAARWSVWALIATRMVVGLSEGVIFPATSALIGRWAPKMERSRMSSIILAGANVGSAVALVLSGLLCNSDFLGGWPSVFYVFGAVGCIWVILWMCLVSESPEKHPRISKKELLHIITLQDRDCEKDLPIPWKRILSSVPVWALCITHMCQSWGYCTLLIELPNYLANILHFDLKNNGALSAMPQLMFSLSAILASVVADKLREGRCLKTSTIRKTFNSVGFFGAGLCMLIVVFVGCRPGVIVALLSLSMGMLGCVNSGFLVTHVDMSPDYAGTLYGMTNCCAALCGFLTSTYIGWILEDGQTVHRWNIIFITAAAIFTAGGIIYNVFCSAESQNWGKPSKKHQDIVINGEDGITT